MSSKPSSNFKPEVPKPVRNIPNPHDSRREASESAEGDETDRAEGRHLVVGRDITMSGDITACDKLFVEGQIDATMKDGRDLYVAETGTFRGHVTVDEAEVAGVVEGELVVRQRLTVRASGRVSGTVRYGEIAIEVGGVIAGDVNVLDQAGQGADDDMGVAPAAAAPTEETPAAEAAAAGSGIEET